MDIINELRNISLREMFETEVSDILSNYKNGIHEYYYKDEDGLHEIVEMDLLRGRFILDNGDFSEFSWELNSKNIFCKYISGK